MDGREQGSVEMWVAGGMSSSIIDKYIDGMSQEQFKI